MAPPPHFGTPLVARQGRIMREGDGARKQRSGAVYGRTCWARAVRSQTFSRYRGLSPWAVGCPARCSLGRLRPGVILDCGRHEVGTGKKEDDWWLELYALLSRATRHEDLLLMRAPRIEFFLAGPPAGLRKQLEQFAARTKRCRSCLLYTSDAADE